MGIFSEQVTLYNADCLEKLKELNMKIIRTTNPKITFYVHCTDDQIEEATRIGNELVARGCKSSGIKFLNLNVMKQYLLVL